MRDSPHSLRLIAMLRRGLYPGEQRKLSRAAATVRAQQIVAEAQMPPEQIMRMIALCRSGVSVDEARAAIKTEIEAETQRVAAIGFAPGVCLGCEYFEPAQRCWLNLNRGSCSQNAIAQYLGIASGNLSLCERQAAAKSPKLPQQENT